MIKWIKKLFSNILLRAGMIFFFIELLLAGFTLCLLFFAGKRSAGVSHILLNALVILMTASCIICCILILIMIINNAIYGNRVKHNKAYWKDTAAGNAVLVETVNTPYLLPVRYKNPVPGFVIGMLVFISIPILACSVYIDFSGFGLRQIAVLSLVIYVQILVTVFLIRLSRRLRAFHVKTNKNCKRGNELDV